MVKKINAFVKVAILREYGVHSDIPVAIDDLNNIWISTPKIEEMFGWRSDAGRKKIVSKSFKAFAGKDLKVGKKSAIIPGQGQGKTNFYPFDVCLLLCKWQMKQGNPKAIDLAIAGFADSFERLALQSLGKQVDDELQQLKLKIRQEGKITRRTWTDAVKEWLDNYSAQFPNYNSDNVWSNVSDKVNIAIFNRRAKTLRTDWDVESPKLLRDYMTPGELDEVKMIENQAMRILDKHPDQLTPTKALDLAIESLIIKKSLR